MAYFRNIYPDISVKQVYNILGKPDDEIIINDSNDPGNNLVYYNQDGRLLLNWSGDEEYPIGVIEFKPKKTLFLKDLINKEVKIERRVLSIRCNDNYKIIIHLNTDSSIKEIKWWNN